jgi:hypothetical protein
MQLNNLRYADNTIVLTGTGDDLQIRRDKITEISCRYGLDINIHKTKIMIIFKENYWSSLI